MLTAYASEPPPADLTRTYDNAELNQLLTKAAQSRLEQAVPEFDGGAQREANTSSNSAPTVRPPTATSGSFVTRVKGDDAQPMAPLGHDSAVDSSDDDLTHTFEARSFSNLLPTAGARSDLPTEPLEEARFGSDFADGGGPFGLAPHTAPGHDRQRSRSSRVPTSAWTALAALVVLGMGLELVVVLVPHLPLGGLGSPPTSSGDKELTTGRRGGSTGRVFIDIAVEPPGSTLRLDGQPASNPLRLAYPMDGALHEIVASAPGLTEKSLELRFDRDISVVIVLSP